jgi:hypothetical protein
MSPASPGNACMLWNAMVLSLIHKRPPSVPILSQISQVSVSPSHFLKIHYSIILPSLPGSSKWTLSLQVSSPKLYAPLCLPYVPLAQPTSFLLWSPEYLVSSTDPKAPCYVATPPVTLFLLGPNIVLSTLFLNTLCLSSYLCVVYICI